MARCCSKKYPDVVTCLDCHQWTLNRTLHFNKKIALCPNQIISSKKIATGFLAIFLIKLVRTQFLKHGINNLLTASSSSSLVSNRPGFMGHMPQKINIEKKIKSTGQKRKKERKFFSRLCKQDVVVIIRWLRPCKNIVFVYHRNVEKG